MKTILKYIAVFLAGAITYHFAVLYLISSFETPGGSETSVSISEEENDVRFGMGSSYFESELHEVCNYLAENDCSCKPVVRTEYKCKEKLNDFVREKVLGLKGT